MIVAIEGIDGSGKTTQAELLAAAMGWELIHFPSRDTLLGRAIASYLAGEENLSPAAAQLLFAADRYQEVDRIKELAPHGLVIDRYIMSGLAYGAALGLDVDWLITLQKHLPQPDLTIVLDVPVITAMNRLAGKDIYEADAAFLRKVHSAYFLLSHRLEALILDGTQSMGEVHKNIIQAVKGGKRIIC